MAVFIFQILHDDVALKDAFFVLCDESWNLLQRIDLFVFFALKFGVGDHLAVNEVL